jgi:predicted component of type VI protein secretion system
MDDGQVRITLKDVYQQTQQLEKSLSDSLAALNLTMTQIKAHIAAQDQRNTAADLLQAEHGTRLTAIEATLNQSQPVATHQDQENRIRSLERFKYMLLGAVIVVNTGAAYIEYLLRHGH